MATKKETKAILAAISADMGSECTISPYGSGFLLKSTQRWLYSSNAIDEAAFIEEIKIKQENGDFTRLAK